ncbi:MAG: UDP-2,3-diacylglucosamine diphosphatase [Planctomycetota bacterium]|nr:UDP-2,3-diacylglucosamine diphosphatase [Planctomycetota bacterium]
MKLRYRTVFLSDTHLGSRGSRAAELARFLKRVRCDRLYLVGDIVDISSLRQRWHWPAEHNDVVRRLLKIAGKGAEIVYIPGNHDASLREYLFVTFGGLRFCAHDTHTTADGRKLFITHGDQFDLVVQNSPLLAALGTWTYDWLLMVNGVCNAMRRRVGLPNASLAQAIKLKVKAACKLVSNFEGSLKGDARRRGVDGVVCGHIHKPEIRREPGEVEYYNCGDWIENCTALVEHEDGRLELINGIAAVDELEARHRARRAAAAVAGPAGPGGDSAIRPSPLRDEPADVLVEVN